MFHPSSPRRVSSILAFASLLTVGGCAGCLSGPLTYDDSPDAQDGVAPLQESTAGIAVGLAGNDSTLYVVTADAGVWRSGSSGGYAILTSVWRQLWNSPPRAFSIAVDPNDIKHVAVGQREGDQLANNTSGVRESFDSGETWPNYFNPSLAPLDCSLQGISSLAFSQKSTLFFSTACGIGVKAAGAATASYPSLPTGSTAITAVAASETKLWARTAAGIVLVSTDEGTKWVLATSQPLPSNGNNFNTRGDSTSLGAWDNFVFMSSRGADRIVNGVAANNYNQLTILDVNNDKWVVQSRIDDSVNGEGAGGRRQVKSYIFSQPKGTTNRQLYFSSAQEIYRSTGQNTDGTLTWEKIAASSSSGVAPDDKQFTNILHSDFWDFHASAGGSDLWIASDGGVAQNTPQAQGWVMRSSGLHTQHVQTLYVPDPDLHQVYPTHDNDGWFRSSAGVWQHASINGDASWTSGDVGNPAGVLVARRTGPCSAHCSCGNVITFNANSSAYNIACSLVNQSANFNGPESIAFIQTIPSEGNPAPKLDALLLTNLPLTYDSGSGTSKNVPGSLGNAPPAAEQGLVILRNPNFLDHPDPASSNNPGTGWVVFADNLPQGTNRFWVSNGHSSPVVLALAAQSGVNKLFRTQGQVLTNQHSTWSELNVAGNIFQTRPWPDAKILSGGTLGPVFINPYNSTQIYVLTANGVMYSPAGGVSFSIDQPLTDLVNGKGTFPMVGNFSGSTGFTVDYDNSYVSASMGTLSALSFNREKPNERVAASPFTGIFYSPGNGVWTDLSNYLPQPATSVSDVSIVGNRIYIATEGRSLLYMDQFRPTWKRWPPPAPRPPAPPPR